MSVRTPSCSARLYRATTFSGVKYSRMERFHWSLKWLLAQGGLWPTMKRPTNLLPSLMYDVGPLLYVVILPSRPFNPCGRRRGRSRATSQHPL